jgi:hypothetical protein
MEVDDDAQFDGGVFQHTAMLAGLPLVEWHEIARPLTEWQDRHGLLRHLIKHSARSSTTILFCFGDTILLQYDGTIAFSNRSLRLVHSKERIKGANEVVDPSAHFQPMS